MPLHLCLSDGLRVCLSSLCFHKTNSVSLILHILFHFYFFDFCPDLYYFIIFTVLGLLYFHFSKTQRYKMSLSIYDISDYLMQTLRSTCFPHRTSFIVSHRFGSTMISFSFNSRIFLFLLYFFDAIFSSLLFNFCIF